MSRERFIRVVDLKATLGQSAWRFDIGDEMYFNGGTHHNLRATFGPVIRF
jgi:hypothetical protein